MLKRAVCIHLLADIAGAEADFTKASAMQPVQQDASTLCAQAIMCYVKSNAQGSLILLDQAFNAWHCSKILATAKFFACVAW